MSLLAKILTIVWYFLALIWNGSLHNSLFVVVMEPSLGLLRKMNVNVLNMISYHIVISTKDLDILKLTKDSNSLNPTKDLDIHGPPIQSDIPYNQGITNHEGILRENFIFHIIEDWKGIDYNILSSILVFFG
jgi:hypothetical protein